MLKILRLFILIIWGLAALLLVFWNVVPDQTLNLILGLIPIDIDVPFEGKLSETLIIQASKRDIIFAGNFFIVLIIPVIKFVKWFKSLRLQLLGEDLDKKLMRFREYLSDKDRVKKFFGKIYVQRGSCPVTVLTPRDGPDFLMLIRGVEEVRAYRAGKLDPYNHFEQLQENDYKTLFLSSRESYYVTSYEDHDVWVILENSDLRYYIDNFSRDRRLKRLSKLKFWRVSGMAPRAPGIHRMFVISREEEDGLQDAKNLLYVFVTALKRFLEDGKSFELSNSLATGVGISVSQNPMIVRDKLKQNAIIRLLFVLLAGKLHESLTIDFAIVFASTLTPQQKDNLLLAPSDCLSDWQSIGWSRLGSAMIDDLIVGYADQKADKKTIICYKFLQHIQKNFESAAVRLLSPHGGHSMFTQMDPSLIKSLTDIANRIAGRIRVEHRRTTIPFKLATKITRNRLV